MLPGAFQNQGAWVGDSSNDGESHTCPLSTSVLEITDVEKEHPFTPAAR